MRAEVRSREVSAQRVQVQLLFLCWRITNDENDGKNLFGWFGALRFTVCQWICVLSLY